MATWIYQTLNAGTNGTIALSNTMYLRNLAGTVLTTTELTPAVAQIRVFYDQLKTIMTSTQSWVPGQRVLQLDANNPATPKVIVPVAPAAAVLGTGGVQTVNQAAVCLAWRTAVAGRSYRGRTFLGVLAATTVAGGVMSGGMVTTIQNAGNALITNLAALTVPIYLCVYSKTVPGGNAQLITSCATDAIPDVLRSRKR